MARREAFRRRAKKRRAPIWKAVYFETALLTLTTFALGIVAFIPIVGFVGLILGGLCVFPYAVTLAIALKGESMALRHHSARYAWSAMFALLVAGACQCAMILAFYLGPPDPVALLVPFFGGLYATVGGTVTLGITMLIIVCLSAIRSK